MQAMTGSGIDVDHEKLRFLLKISSKPDAVAQTADSQLIVGSTGGLLVMFNLKLLKPSPGNETSTGSSTSRRFARRNCHPTQMAFSRTQKQQLSHCRDGHCG